MTRAKLAKFAVGTIIHHKRFDYRGVIVDVDPDFQLSEEWYDQVALSRPPKDEPWYRVLVHNSSQETYVAERHLEPDASANPVVHPELHAHFRELQDGHYVRHTFLN